MKADTLRRSLFGIYGLLVLANLGAWAWALIVFRHQPLLLGTAPKGCAGPDCDAYGAAKFTVDVVK